MAGDSRCHTAGTAQASPEETFELGRARRGQSDESLAGQGHPGQRCPCQRKRPPSVFRAKSCTSCSLSKRELGSQPLWTKQSADPVQGCGKRSARAGGLSQSLGFVVDALFPE